MVAAMRTAACGSSSPLLCLVSLFSVFKCSPSFLFSKPSPTFLHHFPCIYRQPGERHHTLSKCRAWRRGMAPIQPLQGIAFFFLRRGGRV